MGRSIGLLFTLAALAAAAFAQPGITPEDAARVWQALALSETGSPSPEAVLSLGRQATKHSSPLVTLATLTALARTGWLDEQALERACALALSPELDLAMRRQALSTLSAQGALLPEADAARLMADPDFGESARDILFPQPIYAFIQMPEPPLRDGCTLLIHGSFGQSPNSAWYLPEAGFCAHLNGSVGNVWRIVADNGQRVVPLTPLAWPADQATIDAIEAAVPAVAAHLREVAADLPPPIDIVAHSNGGNVIVRALTELAHAGTPLHVRTLVLLGTPHLERDGHLVYWPADASDPLFSEIEHLINIQSPEDIVVTTLAAAAAGVPSGRELAGRVPSAVDLGVQTSVGCFNAHTVLHSNVMAGVLGQALTGQVAWAPESFPQITDPEDLGLSW